MIKLTGTIPIMYVHVKYNIPVTLWISERYPQDPPIAYVNPTPSMVIKRDHAYVGTNGIIQTPYFARWRKEMSDLVGAVGDMVEVFGQEPPLFAKVTPPPVTQYPAFAAPTTSAQGYNPGSNSAGNPAVYNPRPAFQPPTATATYSAKTESGHSEAVATVERVRGLYRETLIKALFERANRSVMSLSQDVRSKTSKSEEDNAYLKQRAQQIQTGIAMLQEERQTYEHNVQTMAVIVGVMTDWKNKAGLSDVPAGEERKAEDVIVPQDPLAAQQLKAQSEDLAAEDCLNALDKLLLKDRIDLDSYLKQVGLCLSAGEKFLVCRFGKFVVFSTLHVR